jgi:hypothetical protein
VETVTTAAVPGATHTPLIGSDREPQRVSGWAPTAIAQATMGTTTGGELTREAVEEIARASAIAAVQALQAQHETATHIQSPAATVLPSATDTLPRMSPMGEPWTAAEERAFFMGQALSRPSRRSTMAYQAPTARHLAGYPGSSPRSPYRDPMADPRAMMWRGHRMQQPPPYEYEYEYGY